MAPNQNHPQQAPTEDFTLKATKPLLGGGRVSNGDGLSTTFNLVEQMHYLYVRVVKARDLPSKDSNGSADPYVVVKLGNLTGATPHFKNKLNPQWNLVFAFGKDRIQASRIEIYVKDKDVEVDDIMGWVVFELNEVPLRVPPDSPLAPQWYRLENRKGDRGKGELMLAVWMGTQADEAFPDSWHSDASFAGDDGIGNIRSKVYLAPRLWYLRVSVIEAQDLLLNDKNRKPEVFARGILGNLNARTGVSREKSINPTWNEDLMFVVAEPFDESLILDVVDRLGNNKDEVLGKCSINLHTVFKRLDAKPVQSRWCNLEKVAVSEGEQKRDSKFASRLHVIICLEGGYHVLDESTIYSSDLNPTAKQLWKPSIGVLELGILNANGLQPMKTRDGKATTDAYCVVKYGQKWVRTRTIIDSLAPKWNEQYTWEVFDPCTVITIGVFDNGHLKEKKHDSKEKKHDSKDREHDSVIGKVRIRLSTLDIDRVYTYSYQLLVIRPSGVKKMGVIQLAFRFSSLSFVNTMSIYKEPLLPKMHYLYPLTQHQVENLRHQATQIVSMRLSRAEPPLRKEAVEYMLDVGSHSWSLRKGKANYNRIANGVSSLVRFYETINEVCKWKNTTKTIRYHIGYLLMVLCPKFILPSFFFYWFFIGIWNYFRKKPKDPLHMDRKLSFGDRVQGDELDEEFDNFPTNKSGDVLKKRYDRLRIINGGVQEVLGDLAGHVERVAAFLSWRDPRASALFVVFCLTASIVLLFVPPKLVLLICGFYVLRHPWFFRTGLPSAPLNFFKRLPTRADNML